MAINPGIKILLTRPAAQSAAYTDELRRVFGGHTDIVQSPLLEIALVETVLDLAGVHHLLFTSVNAVHAFTRLSDRRDIACLCVGDRTAKAAQRAGLDAISAKGNSDDLSALAIETAKGRAGHFLHLRGRHIAMSLAKDIPALKELVIYEQNPLELNAAAIRALTSQGQVLVPLFSPRTVAIFMEQIAGLAIVDVTAICISQNVADRLDGFGVGKILVADQPNAGAVTREIAASL